MRQNRKSKGRRVGQTTNVVGFWPPLISFGKWLKDFKQGMIRLDFHFRKPLGQLCRQRIRVRPQAMALVVKRLLKFAWRAGDDSLNEILMGLSAHKISIVYDRSASLVRRL